MEATRKRILQNGSAYNNLFPKATGNNQTIQKDANVSHTVAFIPKVVHETLDQTKQIAQKLKGKNHYETCSNIWHFVYRHIGYRKDAAGYEQIRSPARTWHDRFKGVDCDCYTVFISSILTNLGIPHILRITKYHRDYFQHIYPIVPTVNGHVTIDCVTDQFNYEVPYSEKKDYPMDLQYLNGFDNKPALYHDPNDFYLQGADDGTNALNSILRRRFSRQGNYNAYDDTELSDAPEETTTAPVKKKKGFKGFLHKINRFNPALIALRNGILASMKLNIANVAKRLRWSYLPAEETAKYGINPEKFQKLIATRQKLESLLYKAGGKPENLKKAILKGKGNKDKSVHGFSGFDGMTDDMNAYTPLSQLLGPEIYYSENIEGMQGIDDVGTLGEPITLATITAASGVIAAIVGMLKKVGDIFQQKTKGSEDFNEATNAAAEKEDVAATVKTANSEETSLVKSDASGQAKDSADDMTAGATNDDKPPGFWEQNKKWIKPVAIGVGGIGLLALGMHLFKSSNKPSHASTTKSLHGIPKHRKKKNHHRKSKPVNRKKTAVALL